MDKNLNQCWGWSWMNERKYCSRTLLRTSVWLSVYEWYVVLRWSLVPLRRNNSLQHVLMKMGSQSDTKLRGKLWSLQMVSKNNTATLWAMKCWGRGPRWVPFEYLSTTTMIVVKHWETGNLVMKSMDKSTQRAEGMGKGCNNPASFRVSYFTCWQITH